MGVSVSPDIELVLNTLDRLSIPALAVDENRTVLSANPAAVKVFQYPADELRGQLLSRFVSLQNGEGKSRDGVEFQARITEIPQGAGNLRVIAVQDISGQQKGQQKAQMELINELTGIINSSLSIGTIFRMVVNEIKKFIDYDRASLLLFNETSNNLLIFALDTDMKTIMTKGVKAPIDSTSAGWVIKNNRPHINYDLREAIPFSSDKKLADEGIRSTISVPLYKDHMLGVLNLDSTRPSRYSGKDLQILLSVARHISVALENALLFEEISREKKEWKKTFDAITDMVWIEDRKHRIIRANEALLAKTGFMASQVIGKPCTHVLSKIGVCSSGMLCQETMKNGRPSFREITAASGAIYQFWAYPLPDDEGRMYAVVHYLKDVSEQKRIEQQLIRADRLASLGTLVAGIAHEINNPLGIIAGYSEALLDRAKDGALLNAPEFEDFPEYLETIHKEMFRCKGILRGLLDFASPSAGSVRELDISELIKEVLLLVNHKAKRLDHKIECNFKRDLPKIYGEPGALRQLFMNIIINSLYFTPEKGMIRIETGMERERNCEGKDGAPHSIKVVISDTGAGMPEEIRKRIFDPFFTTKPAGEGTGLGLSICHKIVEEHGGKIDVESRPGAGASFTVHLPINAKLPRKPGAYPGPASKKER